MLQIDHPEFCALKIKILRSRNGNCELKKWEIFPNSMESRLFGDFQIGLFQVAALNSVIAELWRSAGKTLVLFPLGNITQNKSYIVDHVILKCKLYYFKWAICLTFKDCQVYFYADIGPYRCKPRLLIAYKCNLEILIPMNTTCDA